MKNSKKESFESIQFYIIELSKIKDELKKHETEYFPEKVRSLIQAYTFTIKKLLFNCNQFLDCKSEDEVLNSKVKKILTHYSELLRSITRN